MERNLPNQPLSPSSITAPRASIRFRLILAFLAVAILPFSGISLVLVVSGAQTAQQEVANQLGIISTFKESAIQNWQDPLTIDLGSLLAGSQAQDEIDALLQDDPLAADALRQRFLLRMAQSQNFDELLILDPTGLVALSSDRSLEGLDFSQIEDLKPGIRTPYLLPPAYDGQTGKILSYAFYPVENEQGRLIATLVGRVNLDPLAEILNERTGLGVSGRAYLVSKDRLLVSGLSAAEQGSPIYTEAVILGLQNQGSGNLTYRGSDGAPVVGVYRWLPALQALLVIEQSQFETVRGTLATLAVNISVALSSIIIALFIALSVTRSISTPVSELAEISLRLANSQDAAARRQALQQLQAPPTPLGASQAGSSILTDSSVPAEIGLLAQAFNQMTAELQLLIESLEERVALRTSQLQQRSNYLEASAQVSQSASSILEIDQLLQSSVELIVERFNLYYVGLFLVASEMQGEEADILSIENARQDANIRNQGWAILRAGTGEAGQKMLNSHHRLPIGASMIGWAIMNSQSRIAQDVSIEDASLDSVRVPNPDLPETRSEAAIPMRSRGRVIGALSVQSSQPNAFDQPSISALQSLADQLAVAIDNAILFARTQNALQAERRTYAVQSQTAWADLLRSRGAFSLHAAQGLTQVGSPVWQPEMEQAARNGEIVETAGAVALPLIVRGSVIAVLNIQRKGTRSAMNSPALNPDELAFLTNVTEQLANALDSARLYAETRQRAEQERLVADVSSRMRMSLDVEQVLETAIEDLYKALELESLTITLSPTGGPEGGQP